MLGSIDQGVYATANGSAPVGEAGATRSRRPSTPLRLRLAMVLAGLPVAVFALAVHLGVERNDDTVRTVALDATRGITVAQAIKLNLAELDELVVQDLVEVAPLGPSGFPDDYADKRSELHENLVLASSDSSEGSAYQQPLANIDYALGHYHSLVKEAFAAQGRGDPAMAAEIYGRAHLVMDGTLLVEADFVDKANTYVLNIAYDRQKARAASTGRLIVVSWIVLLALLVAAQLLVARKFRRLVNLPLVAASVVTAATGWYAVTSLDSSASHLTMAREQAFDSVHVLARAGATVVAARQSEGHLLLDPDAAVAVQDGFDTQANQLFRVQDDSQDLTALAMAGEVPEGSGGYLARIALADGRDDSGERAVEAFGGFLLADHDMRQLVAAGEVARAASIYRNGEAFTELTDVIAQAQSNDQATFDGHAGKAADATAHVDRVTLIAAAGILLLILLGLYQRLREYGS